MWIHNFAIIECATLGSGPFLAQSQIRLPLLGGSGCVGEFSECRIPAHRISMPANFSV
jgi:hypothetical protein